MFARNNRLCAIVVPTILWVFVDDNNACHSVIFFRSYEIITLFIVCKMQIAKNAIANNSERERGSLEKTIACCGKLLSRNWL